jgi:hypothetical protein
MTTELLEAIEQTLPNLETIKEQIIQIEVTRSNRAKLDEAYVAAADAIRTLSALSAAAQSTTAPRYVAGAP